MLYPSWPLGTKFGDRDGRIFEVRHVVMGIPEEGLCWEVETHEGWRITSRTGDCPQTKVGFVQSGVEYPVMIYESPEELDKYVKNRHLIRL